MIDFTFGPEIDWTKSEEDFIMYHAIFGFSAGFPVCCVIDFIKNHLNDQSHYSNRVGIHPLTLQTFALCDGEHEGIVSMDVDVSRLEESMDSLTKMIEDEANKPLNTSQASGSVMERSQ